MRRFCMGIVGVILAFTLTTRRDRGQGPRVSSRPQTRRSKHLVDQMSKQVKGQDYKKKPAAEPTRLAEGKPADVKAAETTKPAEKKKD